jgi:hypothetical protein
MADQFATGVQLPNVPNNVSARDADTGFIRLYAKENVLYGRLPDGTEFPIAGGEGFPIFIQDDQPVTTSQKYAWIQTNYLEPGGVTFWYEDGEA